MRVDRATTPPGLLTPSKAWTLMRTDDGFWMIRLPRPAATRDHGAAGPHEVDAAPDLRDMRDLDALAADGRAVFHAWADVTSLRIVRRSTFRQGSFPVARLTGPRRLTIEFAGCDEQIVREFFAPVGHLLG